MDPVVVWILRLSLALLLGAAALHKLRDPSAFTRTLRDYRILPAVLAPSAVPAVVAVEALLAAMLLLPFTATAAGLSTAGLLGLYSAAIATNLARGRRFIDCGCLGPGARQPLSGWLLVRNGVLMLAGALLALPVGARPLTWVDGVSIAGAVAVLALLFHATNALATLVTSTRDLRRSA